MKNKIKIATDLEQSRKLAEFLPLESADMLILNNVGESGDVDGTNCTTILKENLNPLADVPEILPCWSLAALLAILPNEIITDNKFECHYQIDIRKYNRGNNTTFHQIAYGNNRGLSGSWHDMINTGEKESLIDCCVQMILKLHVLKLI